MRGCDHGTHRPPEEALLQGTGSFRTIGSFLANLVAHLAFIQEYLGQKNFVGGSWTPVSPQFEPGRNEAGKFLRRPVIEQATLVEGVLQRDRTGCNAAYCVKKPIAGLSTDDQSGHLSHVTGLIRPTTWLASVLMRPPCLLPVRFDLS